MSTGGVIFVDAKGNCCRLSTQEVPSVEVWCPGGDFCLQAGAFLWTRRGNVAACPRRRCLAWKFGARRRLLSTQEVPGVEVRCLEVVFVHRRGHFCGCGEGIAAACPRIGCPAWKSGAQGVTFGGRRALRFRLFSVFKISNSKKRKMLCCREENFTQNVVREGVCC